MAIRKKIEKYWLGARQEGEKPDIPKGKRFRRKDGRPSDLPTPADLGPHRVDFTKQEMFLKHQVNYNLATPQQVAKGEACETCLYWKDGAACHLVLGYIDADMWCNKWEQSDVLQKGLGLKAPKAVQAKKNTVFDKLKQHPSVHSHRDDHPTHLHVQIHKEGNGGGGEGGGFGGGEGSATVFTSTNAGIFNPTYGERDTKKKKKKSDKKTGIERLGHFVTDNTPEKKMMKSATETLTEVLNSVRIELRKEDQKRQTPYKSAPIETDPPQVIETDAGGATEDGSLVVDQDNTEKEQKKIMDQDKNKSETEPTAISNAQVWGSGPNEVSEYHRGGTKDNVEPDEDRTEKESQDIKLNRKKRTAQLVKEEGYTWGKALFKAVEEEIDD